RREVVRKSGGMHSDFPGARVGRPARSSRIGPAMPKDARSSAAAELRVGGWCVQSALNQIREGDTVRRLEPQVMDLLVFLAGSGGRVVSRDDIIDAVWEGRFIAETTLTRSIADLRRALGDTEPERRYIETIAKRGYRLIAPVSVVSELP